MGTGKLFVWSMRRHALSLSILVDPMVTSLVRRRKATCNALIHTLPRATNAALGKQGASQDEFLHYCSIVSLNLSTALLTSRPSAPLGRPSTLAGRVRTKSWL